MCFEEGETREIGKTGETGSKGSTSFAHRYGGQGGINQGRIEGLYLCSRVMPRK